MILVEKHKIKKDSKFYSVYLKSCKIARQIKNICIKEERKRFFAYKEELEGYCKNTGLDKKDPRVKKYMKEMTQKYPEIGVSSKYELDRILNKNETYTCLYHSIPAASSQMITQQVTSDIKGFFKKYMKGDKTAKLPKQNLKNKYYVLSLSNQKFKLKEKTKLRNLEENSNFVDLEERPKFVIITTKSLQVGKEGLTINSPAYKRPDFISYQRICFRVREDYIEVLLYFKVKDSNIEYKDNHRYISIDLGVNNYATVINNLGLPGFIINGKGLQFKIYRCYRRLSELKSKLKKRENRDTSKQVEAIYKNLRNYKSNYEHQVSRYIINYCIQNNINTIIVGYNKNWKQRARFKSKRTGLVFQQMSYFNFLQKLKYKAKIVGIEVEEQEESYTSKTSYLDLETPCEHQVYKGNRIYRGLFESSQGKYINADINGAYQILRKKHATDVNINICNIESKRVYI